ncbi:phosphatase PAP2 family protein (plasmid) [Streptomyces sp. BI20]|uniref:phosphatase PAP2 family protein n=1 Tax=Streptomyces sp. BI20 TaxID=3403460 RepID=UPI003C726634
MRGFPRGCRPRRPALVLGAAWWSALIAGALFSLLTLWVVRAQGRLLPGEAVAHRWSVEHRPPAVVVVARALTDTGTGVLPYLLLLAGGLVAGRTPRGGAVTAALLLSALGAGQAVRYAVMTGVGRARPPIGDWATRASGWAFPSGHAATAAMTAGLLVAALSLRGDRPPRAAVAAIALWGAAVGLTRVELGVHWVGDVIGGWLFAAMWLSLLIGLYLRWSGRRTRGQPVSRRLSTKPVPVVTGTPKRQPGREPR